MGPEKIVQMMLHGEGDAGLIEAAAKALGEISASDPGRVACMAAGALPALVVALRTHVGVAGCGGKELQCAGQSRPQWPRH